MTSPRPSGRPKAPNPQHTPEKTPRGPEVRATMRQLWRLNELDGALDEALVNSSGETRSHVSFDAAHGVLVRRKADGQF